MYKMYSATNITKSLNQPGDAGITDNSFAFAKAQKKKYSN